MRVDLLQLVNQLCSMMSFTSAARLAVMFMTGHLPLRWRGHPERTVGSSGRRPPPVAIRAADKRARQLQTFARAANATGASSPAYRPLRMVPGCWGQSLNRLSQRPRRRHLRLRRHPPGPLRHLRHHRQRRPGRTLWPHGKRRSLWRGCQQLRERPRASRGGRSRRRQHRERRLGFSSREVVCT